LLQAFAAAFEARELFGRFQLTSCGCLGVCDAGPMVLVYPDGVLYGGVGDADVAAIIDEHLLGDAPVARLRVPAEVWG
jgi:(2Fe-2S) ferredoxin